MTAAKKPLRFRRGLTFYQREQLREQVREAEFEKARRRAESAHLTMECRNAMALSHSGIEDPDYLRDLHNLCKGELPGAVGCLCQHHDVVVAEEMGVVSGHIEVPA